MAPARNVDNPKSIHEPQETAIDLRYARVLQAKFASRRASHECDQAGNRHFGAGHGAAQDLNFDARQLPQLSRVGVQWAEVFRERHVWTAEPNTVKHLDLVRTNTNRRTGVQPSAFPGLIAPMRAGAAAKIDAKNAAVNRLQIRMSAADVR